MEKQQIQEGLLAAANLFLFFCNFLFGVLPPIWTAIQDSDRTPVIDEGQNVTTRYVEDASSPWSVVWVKVQEFFTLDEAYVLTGIYLVPFAGNPWFALLAPFVSLGAFVMLRDVPRTTRAVMCILLAIQIAGLGVPAWERGIGD